MQLDISSPSNPKIKWLRGLHNNSARRKEGVFLVEGAKEIALALDGGYQPQSFFIAPEIAGESSETAKVNEMYTISKACFEKVAYRSGSDGILAVFHEKTKNLTHLTFSDNPFFIIVEAVEKPGNLGAIIRTADGAGADGVIVCDEKVDIFNPNVIRASVGTLFTTQVVAASNLEVLDFLEKHEITPYGAILSKNSSLYFNQDFTRPTAVVVGTEHEGLSSFWKENSKPIIIPMAGVNDSLNVSNALAVLAYEVIRQRHED
jgi:TrmH family RNA methyltransferase